MGKHQDLLDWRKGKFDDFEKLVFRTADMNDPDVLKSFLRLNGIPNRPYQELALDLSLFLEKKRVVDGDPQKVLIQKLSTKCGDLEKQLANMGVKPRYSSFSPTG